MPSTVCPLSGEDKLAWRKQNLRDLAVDVALPFAEKIAILDKMQDVILGLRQRRQEDSGPP